MNILTADLDIQLTPGDRALDLLRRVHEYKIPGYDPMADSALLDTEPVWCLAEQGLITFSWEGMGAYDSEGREEEGRVWRLTEEGLTELVLHGRAR